MSDYCTNCKWLGKESIANRTNWLCKKDNQIGYILVSLCGNPARLTKCMNNNWYEDKNKCKTCNGKLTETIGAELVCFKCNKGWNAKQEKKMKTEERIKIMQAYVDGKQIQFLEDDKTWHDCTIAPNWNWRDMDYRIKPEPKYRPLKPEELVELKSKWLKHKDGNMFMCTGIVGDRIELGGNLFGLEALFKYWTYEDGTQIGKLEEQND